MFLFVMESNVEIDLWQRLWSGTGENCHRACSSLIYTHVC